MSSYQLCTHYVGDDRLRESFNALTRLNYGFDFTQWHRLGLWTERYSPHSIVQGGQVVANVSVNHMCFLRGGVKIDAIQLGTVMTHPDHRGKGLSRRLLEGVLEEAGELPVYLFANDTVLDFYPRFGMRPGKQMRPVRPFPLPSAPSTNSGISTRRLGPETPADWELLLRLAQSHHPTARLSMVENPSLLLFHCLANPDGLFYFPELDTVVIAEQDADSLTLLDILSGAPQNPLILAAAVATPGTNTLRLGYTPPDLQGWSLEEVEDADTLFFCGKNLLEAQEQFPALSHA